MKTDLMALEDLVKEVNALEDYENASNALMQIAHRVPELGAELALKILREARGDEHFQAFAFNMLYSANRSQALIYVREHMLSAGAKVFASMLSEVAEDVGMLEESNDLKEIVAGLSEALRQRPQEQLLEFKKSVELFARTYAVNWPT